MTGAPGVVEAVLAVIGLVVVLVTALFVAIVIVLHALDVKPIPRTTVGDVDWDAVRAEVDHLTPADFNKGGSK